MIIISLGFLLTSRYSLGHLQEKFFFLENCQLSVQKKQFYTRENFLLHFEGKRAFLIVHCCSFFSKTKFRRVFLYYHYFYFFHKFIADLLSLKLLVTNYFNYATFGQQKRRTDNYFEDAWKNEQRSCNTIALEPLFFL